MDMDIRNVDYSVDGMQETLDYVFSKRYVNVTKDKMISRLIDLHSQEVAEKLLKMLGEKKQVARKPMEMYYDIAKAKSKDIFRIDGKITIDDNTNVFTASTNENHEAIQFSTQENIEVIRLENNGDIFIKGEEATNNQQVVEGMKMVIKGNMSDDYKTMLKRLNDANELLNVQGQDGNWNFDDYMLGMFNGMELIISCMEDREVNYKTSESLKK